MSYYLRSAILFAVVAAFAITACSDDKATSDPDAGHQDVDTESDVDVG